MGSGDRSSGPQKCVASTSAAESSPGRLSVLKLSRYSVTPNTLERTTVPLHCSGEDESLHMRSAEERSPDGFNSQTGLADPEPSLWRKTACWRIVSWRKKGKSKKWIVTFE